MQASDQIVECRRILKWTYAYSFYKFDTLDLPTEPSETVSDAAVAAAAAEIDGVDRRRTFFEFLQNDAESSLEMLSKALEVDMKRFHHVEDFWRLTAKLGLESRRSDVRTRILLFGLFLSPPIQRALFHLPAPPQRPGACARVQS